MEWSVDFDENFSFWFDSLEEDVQLRMIVTVGTQIQNIRAKAIMKKNLDDYLNALTPRQRKIVDALTEEMLAEEMSLQQLRKALQHSQQTLADKLNVKQAEISKMERRTDMYVSTLRDYIESMGGKLEITVSFPNLKSVKINQFELLEPEPPQPKRLVSAGKAVKSARRKYVGTAAAKKSAKPGEKKTTSKAKRRAS